MIRRPAALRTNGSRPIQEEDHFCVDQTIIVKHTNRCHKDIASSSRATEILACGCRGEMVQLYIRRRKCERKIKKKRLSSAERKKRIMVGKGTQENNREVDLG